MHAKSFFSQNNNVFSVLSIFKYNPGKINNQFITSQLFLSSDVPTSPKRKLRIVVQGSVARYGPQSVASVSG